MQWCTHVDWSLLDFNPRLRIFLKTKIIKSCKVICRVLFFYLKINQNAFGGLAPPGTLGAHSSPQTPDGLRRRTRRKRNRRERRGKEKSGKSLNQMLRLRYWEQWTRMSEQTRNDRTQQSGRYGCSWIRPKIAICRHRLVPYPELRLSGIVKIAQIVTLVTLPWPHLAEWQILT